MEKTIEKYIVKNIFASSNKAQIKDKINEIVTVLIKKDLTKGENYEQSSYLLQVV